MKKIVSYFILIHLELMNQHYFPIILILDVSE